MQESADTSNEPHKINKALRDLDWEAIEYYMPHLPALKRLEVIAVLVLLVAMYYQRVLGALAIAGAIMFVASLLFTGGLHDVLLAGAAILGTAALILWLLRSFIFPKDK